MYDLDKNKSVAVLSGGLDSTAALYVARKSTTVVAAVSFNYGQKHAKELEYARATCEKLGIAHHVFDLTQLTEPLSRVSSLVSGGEAIPQGHYAADNMASTVVPNRNMMMLSIAASLLPVHGAANLVLGMHGGDHFIYPDCRPGFVEAVAATLIHSFDNYDVHLNVPFLYADKTVAARQGYEAGMRFEDTWSCYQGGEIHCGRCGTCVERLEAINDAGLNEQDGTQYEDTEFWKNLPNYNN